jgi:hypothetical protein
MAARKEVHGKNIPSRPFANPARVKMTGRTGYGGWLQMTIYAIILHSGAIVATPRCPNRI